MGIFDTLTKDDKRWMAPQSFDLLLRFLLDQI
jgi:hypothetical protein